MQVEVKQAIGKLAEQVNALRAQDEFKGYLASPLLKQIIGLLEQNLDEERQTLHFAYRAYAYIAENYSAMGRFSLGAIYNQKALDMALKVYYVTGMAPDNVDNVFFFLLRDRNHYVDDDCVGVLNKIKDTGIIHYMTVEKIYDSRMSKRRTLVADPIEMSEEYLACIDEVEATVDNEALLQGAGACHERWALKRVLLEQRGIKWKSPTMLNPSATFD